jgi:hypothetical protein
MPQNQYNLTLYEVCEILGKQRRTISRYIKDGLLHPITINSHHNTREYRFSMEDVQACKTIYPAPPLEQDMTGIQGHDKPRHEEIRQDETPEKAIKTDQKNDTTDETRQEQPGSDRSGGDMISVPKATLEILHKQLEVKDIQIAALSALSGQLIDRDRETNILLQQLQSKVPNLPQPRAPHDGVVESEEKQIFKFYDQDITKTIVGKTV